MCIATQRHSSSSTKIVLPLTSLLSKQDQTALVRNHNYHDRSQEPSKVNRDEWMRVKCSPSSPFPVKLHRLLERVEQDYDYNEQGEQTERGIHRSVISWQPHGRCFIIHKPYEFVTKLLPRYMNLNKLASFQRQLNLYGFTRITRGADKGGYYHEYFLKERGPLALQIQRIKVKGTGVRGKSNPEQEPNLWNMTWVGMTREYIEQQQEASSLISLVERSMTIIPEISDAVSTSKNERDTILMEWGMPFHALDELPQEEGAAKNIVDDNTVLDAIVSSVLLEDKRWQKNQKASNYRDDTDDEPLPQNSSSSFDNIDLWDMLERIVSIG